MSYMKMILEIRLLFHFKIFYSEGININKNVKKQNHYYLYATQLKY